MKQFQNEAISKVIWILVSLIFFSYSHKIASLDYLCHVQVTMLLNFVNFRPNPQEPYSSIWDIEEKKAAPPAQTATTTRFPPNIQHQGPSSWANIARQTTKAVPPPPIPAPQSVPRQRTPITDTQMEIERAEMDRGSWTSSEDFWNTVTAQKSDNHPTKTMPAHVPQTADMAFSVSGSSSSSSLYSSMESVEEENHKEVNMNQKNEMRNQNLYHSNDRYKKIGESGHQQNITATSHIQPKKKSTDISERQMNIDDNNNVYRADSYSEIEKASWESEGYSSTKYLGIQSGFDNQVHVQMKGKSGITMNASTDHGNRVNQRKSVYDDIPTVQKGNKSIENLHSKHQMDDLETRDTSSGMKTNVPFGQGQRTYDTSNMQSKGVFGMPHTNKISSTTDKGSFGKTDTTEGGYGESSANEQNSTSNKSGFGQPRPNLSEQRPGFGQPRPNLSEQRPGFGQPRPNLSEQRPGFGQPRPNLSEQRPGFGQPRPNFSEQRPGFGQPRPNLSEQRPGFGQPRPNLSEQRPGFGQPKPNLSEQRAGLGNPNAAFQANTKNKGGFGRPNMKSDTSAYQTEDIALSENPNNQNRAQRNNVSTENQLTPETEDWNEEIEDFPSDIKQTYSYSLDHVKVSASKNKVISEKQLIATHKKELHFQKTEPVKEVVDLDVTPVDTPELKKAEIGQRSLATSTAMDSTIVPRNTAVEARNTLVQPNIAPHKTSPKENHVDSNRRLQVLKDLSKSPKVQKLAQTMANDAENKNTELYNYQENQGYCGNQQIETDTFKSNMKEQTANATVEDHFHEGKVHSINAARDEVQRELPKTLNTPVNLASRTPTPEKIDEGTVQSVATKIVAEPAPVANQTLKSPDTTTTPQPSSDMPTGLPPHLMQAYLQYLAQSGTDAALSAQNTGLMGGLLPGLGVGLGMPMVSPFGAPLYNPMMPFGMNPLMMNPLLAMSLQTQQQQLAGQLGANVTNNASAVQAENVEVKSVDQTVLKMEMKTDKSDEKEKNEIELEKQEDLASLLRNMDIQTREVTNEQPIPENKERYVQGDLAVTRPNCQDTHFRNSDIFTDNAMPAGKNENLLPPQDMENIRIRRPSKEQNSTLRIPREPSVSSRLYGVQQSSPVTDDPAVIRMSSAEISGTDTFVDHNRQEMRSGAFDEDPSVIRFEKRSIALNSPVKDTDADPNAAVKADGFPQRYDMSGWMSNGPSIVRTIQNASHEGERMTSDSQKMSTRNFHDPGMNRDSTNRFPTPLSIPSRTFTNSQVPSASSEDFGERRPQTSQPPRGRGGFGTPSMPKRPPPPPATSESDRDLAQNTARPSFNTRSLSERFAGIKREDGGGQNGRQFPPRPQERGDGFGTGQFPPRHQTGGDGFSARKLPPRLQAQREKNQQVKDMISQLRKETEASQEAGDVLHLSSV